MRNSQRLAGGWLRALYSVVLTLLLPFIYAYLWWHGRNNKGYRQRWAERGAWQAVPDSIQGGIVFHCVSVGELMAAIPLIEMQLETNPRLPVCVTCTTPTASDLIQQRFAGRVYHCYLPFDTPLAVRRFFHRVRPRALVILETELWPNLVSQAHQQNIAVMLANARMSARSQRGYQRVRWLMQPCWQALTKVIAQNDESAARFIELGCRAERVATAGNIKFDVQINAQTKQEVARYKPLLHGRQVITAASTHEGEEAIMLQAFQRLLKNRPDTLLILVPRHRERFKQVVQLVEDSDLNMVKRSSGRPLTADTQVLLADTMGEMLIWFGIATLATIGGSLIERGGHNPLEAMAYGVPIVSGRHVFNFAEVYRQLDARQAVRWVNDAESLHDTWLGLLVEPATAQRIGAQAAQIFSQHRGATQRTLMMIAESLYSNKDKKSEG